MALQTFCLHYYLVSTSAVVMVAMVTITQLAFNTELTYQLLQSW